MMTTLAPLSRYTNSCPRLFAHRNWNAVMESDGFLDAQGSLVAQATDLGVCASLP